MVRHELASAGDAVICEKCCGKGVIWRFVVVPAHDGPVLTYSPLLCPACWGAGSLPAPNGYTYSPCAPDGDSTYDLPTCRCPRCRGRGAIIDMADFGKEDASLAYTILTCPLCGGTGETCH